jgi:hypothetical protein
MNIQPYRPLELMLDSKLTKYECNDFISVWDSFVPAPFCETLISYFEDIVNNRMSIVETEFSDYEESGSLRGEIQYKGSLNRKDLSILMNYINPKFTYQINQFLSSCVMHYMHEFDQLKHVRLFSSDIKMQKTSPGGGYHIWHYENAAPSHAQRELTWMIYLNDVPEGEGETEFLYQRKRYQPKTGTVVIFPAGMTHVHKGNTVLTTDKYILTGWYNKVEK